MANIRIPFEENKMYHVFNHGNGEDNIFRSDENRRYFMQKYTEYIMPIADTLAYCLMPNHFHFLIRIKSNLIHPQGLENLMELDKSTHPQGLTDLAGVGKDYDTSKKVSQTFGNFLNAYAKAFNKMYQRKGSLFLDNVNRKWVDSDSYFSQLIYYIHLNPVKHGFVKSAQDWYWSSYHAFTETKPTKLCRDEVLTWFGDVSGFIKFHQENAKTGESFSNFWNVPY